MKAVLSKTSELGWRDEVEINTLDELYVVISELKKIQQEYGSKINVKWIEDILLIEVYSNYRE